MTNWRFATRYWSRHRKVVASVMVILGVPLGLMLSVYCVVESVLLARPPYLSPDRIVTVSSQSGPLDSWPTTKFDAWRASSSAFEALAGYSVFAQSISLGLGDTPARIRGAAISASMFDVLQVRPVIGRAFQRDDETRGDVVIVSYGLWLQAFGARQDVVGQQVVLSGRSREVIGVMPASMDFPNRDVSVWFPLDPKIALVTDAGARVSAIVPRCQILGRLKPESTFAQAEAEARLIAGPEPSIGVMSLAGWRSRSVARPLLLLQFVTLVVVLCAMTNAASLLAARSVSRRAELALRFALGASRADIVRQTAAEAAILAVPTWGVAVLSAYGALTLLDSSLGAGLGAPTLTVASWVESAAATVVAVALAAFPPMFMGLRAGGPTDLHLSASSLRGSGRQAIGRSFLVVQTALAMSLLIAALSLAQSLADAVGGQPTYVSEQLVVVDLTVTGAATDGIDRVRSISAGLLAWARTTPEVRRVAVTSDFPLADGGDASALSRVQHSPGAMAMGERSPLRTVKVAGDFFAIMDATVVKGRLFTDDDRAGAPPVAVISRVAATQRFGKDEALGRELYAFGRMRTVVGVIDDITGDPFAAAPMGSVYCPVDQAQQGSGMPPFTLLIAVDGRVDSRLEAAIRTGVSSVDRALLVERISTAHARFRRALAPLRTVGGLTLGVAVLAAAIGSVGVFALLSFSVERRRREIGVRMSLGADPRRIFQLVLKDAGVVFLLALPIGAAVAIALHRIVRASIDGVEPLNPTVVALAAVCSGTAMLLAALLPASRASRTDPAMSLKES